VTYLDIANSESLSVDYIFQGIRVYLPKTKNTVVLDKLSLQLAGSRKRLPELFVYFTWIYRKSIPSFNTTNNTCTLIMRDII